MGFELPERNLKIVVFLLKSLVFDSILMDQLIFVAIIMIRNTKQEWEKFQMKNRIIYHNHLSQINVSCFLKVSEWIEIKWLLTSFTCRRFHHSCHLLTSIATLTITELLTPHYFRYSCRVYSSSLRFLDSNG